MKSRSKGRRVSYEATTGGAEMMHRSSSALGIWIAAVLIVSPAMGAVSIVAPADGFTTTAASCPSATCSADLGFAVSYDGPTPVQMSLEFVNVDTSATLTRGLCRFDLIEPSVARKESHNEEE